MNEWKKVKIGEICEIIKGTTGIASAKPGEYPLVVTALERKTCSSFQFDCEAVCIPLVSSSGHGKKSLNNVHYQKGKFALGTILCAVIPNNPNELDARFLHQYLQFYKDKILVPLMKGAANVSLSMKDIAKVEIPLPSIKKQHELSELFVEAQKKYKELLEESEKQKSYIKLLRQNILQEAIEGKLTEDWRKENPIVKGDPDFDAEALFEKIQEEKCHTDSELLRNSKKKVFESILENEQPFEIPEGWKWVRLGEICKFLSRGKSPKYSQLKKYPVFAQKCNLKNGGISLEQSQFLDPNILPKWKEEYKLLNGDVLVNSTGTGTVMRACFFTNDCLGNYPFVVPDSHISVIRSVDTIEAKYIYYCCIGDTVQNYWEDNLAGSTNQKELYIGVVGNTLIPLPPLKEQKEIVNKVETLLAKVVELEEQITEREEMTKQLMQSIMKDAFREV